MAEREHRVMAVNLIARWLHKAAPLLVQPPRDDHTTSASNMAACARLLVAAGRRGGQRLAVAVIEAEDWRADPSLDVTRHYTAVVRALLLFAATTAREFVLTHYTALTRLEKEEALWARVYNRPYARPFTRTIVAADADAEDDPRKGQAVGSSAHDTALGAPLTDVSLELPDPRNRACSVASVMARMLKASLCPGSCDDPNQALEVRHPYDANSGEVAAALRPRALTIVAGGGSVEAFVPWIQRQEQLRKLNVTAYSHEKLDTVLQAVVAAGPQLEELRLRTEISVISNLLFHSSPITTADSLVGSELTPRFPGLRILHVEGLSSVDLHQLSNAAPVLEELACWEAQGVTAGDWAHLLSHMTRLRSLTIDAPRAHDRVPKFYRALSTMDRPPACPLRVLSCRFTLTRGVTHAVLNAVACHFPDLESMALPVEIFNALALVESGEMAKYGDGAAKTELRQALRAATRRCEDVILWTAQDSASTSTEEALLSVDGLGEFLRLLPNVRRPRPIAIRAADYSTRNPHRSLDTTLWLLNRTTAQSAGIAESSNIEVLHVQKLHLKGPLSGEDLANVARACPNLRDLRCEYGGPRFRIKKSPCAEPRSLRGTVLSAIDPRHVYDSETRFTPFVAEAIFLEWLGSIVDINAAKCCHCSYPQVSSTPDTVLHSLKRLHVDDAPFDDDDAASMDALARLRLLIVLQPVDAEWYL